MGDSRNGPVAFVCQVAVSLKCLFKTELLQCQVQYRRQAQRLMTHPEEVE